MSARQAILGAVRASLRDVPREELPEQVAVTRGYRRDGDADPAVLAERLAARLEGYGAEVRRGENVGALVDEVCAARGLRRLAIPAGLPEAWRPTSAVAVLDRGLQALELDGLDGALTGCAAAIAQTGTLLLDGGERSGRRVLTLVPDHHICVVETEQIVDLVPQGLARVAAAVRERRAPITLISGPSATSDIELSRVAGVHGPRNLIVVLAGRGAPPRPHTSSDSRLREVATSSAASISRPDERT